MPVPALDPAFIDVAVVATPVAEAVFPRIRERRIPSNTEPFDPMLFDKRAEDMLEYAMDLTRVLENGEAVIAGYAWSSADTDLIVTAVRFTHRGLFAYVAGGVDGATYTVTLIAQTTTDRVIQIACEITVSGDAADAIPGSTTPVFGPQAQPREAYLTDSSGAQIYPPFTDVLSIPLNEYP